MVLFCTATPNRPGPGILRRKECLEYGNIGQYQNLRLTIFILEWECYGHDKTCSEVENHGLSLADRKSLFVKRQCATALGWSDNYGISDLKRNVFTAVSRYQANIDLSEHERENF